MNRPAIVADSDVIVYSYGLTACSVCAPKAMTTDQVVTRVNEIEPTGIESAWQFDVESPSFKTGQPNPGPCDKFPESRVHYLLYC